MISLIQWNPSNEQPETTEHNCMNGHDHMQSMHDVQKHDQIGFGWRVKHRTDITTDQCLGSTETIPLWNFSDIFRLCIELG